ncbi:MAG: hypothetical protein KatS3mg108_1923 [Isosphaeraceae bacterium]|jgi:endogenous inhibitor of DNA gyrase (YacG/DUF329 family)|nr:MAG: hypothetical protein KatS3mg108_1923 [Isosphaeraceae bacterium]
MRLNCPICGKAFEFTSFDDQPAFPFCSERCRLIDLGRWIDGDYVIPGEVREHEEAGAVDPPPDETS